MKRKKTKKSPERWSEVEQKKKSSCLKRRNIRIKTKCKKKKQRRAIYSNNANLWCDFNLFAVTYNVYVSRLIYECLVVYTICVLCMENISVYLHTWDCFQVGYFSFFFLLFSIRFISLNSFHYLILIASNVYIIYIHFRAIKREVVERKLQPKAKREQKTIEKCVFFFIFIFLVIECWERML